MIGPAEWQFTRNSIPLLLSWCIVYYFGTGQ